MAKRNRRSLTAEIVARLERSVGEPDKIGGSDRDRMNPGHRFYVPDSGVQITTKIHKERLASAPDDPLTAREEKIISAMIQALRGIGKIEEEDIEQPNTGPKPRKRFPKK